MGYRSSFGWPPGDHQEINAYSQTLAPELAKLRQLAGWNAFILETAMGRTTDYTDYSARQSHAIGQARPSAGTGLSSGMTCPSVSSA